MTITLVFFVACFVNLCGITSYTNSFNLSTTASTSALVLCLQKLKRTVTWFGLLLMAYSMAALVGAAGAGAAAAGANIIDVEIE